MACTSPVLEERRKSNGPARGLPCPPGTLRDRSSAAGSGRTPVALTRTARSRTADTRRRAILTKMTCSGGSMSPRSASMPPETSLTTRSRHCSARSVAFLVTGVGALDVGFVWAAALTGVVTVLAILLMGRLLLGDSDHAPLSSACCLYKQRARPRRAVAGRDERRARGLCDLPTAAIHEVSPAQRLTGSPVPRASKPARTTWVPRGFELTHIALASVR